MYNIAKWGFFYVNFAYEKLTLFCFIRVKLGHEESFYPNRILRKNQDFKFRWDLSLRAPRRRAMAPISVWLRVGDDRSGSAGFLSSQVIELVDGRVKAGVAPVKGDVGDNRASQLQKKKKEYGGVQWSGP